MPQLIEGLDAFTAARGDRLVTDGLVDGAEVRSRNYASLGLKRALEQKEGR